MGDDLDEEEELVSLDMFLSNLDPRGPNLEKDKRSILMTQSTHIVNQRL